MPNILHLLRPFIVGLNSIGHTHFGKDIIKVEVERNLARIYMQKAAVEAIEHSHCSKSIKQGYK